MIINTNEVWSMLGKREPMFHKDEQNTSNKILHSCFKELVNYVEIDRAMIYRTQHSEDNIQTNFAQMIKLRNAKFGLLNLEEMAEKFPEKDTGKLAKDVLELYHWWKNVRPARQPIYDLIDIDETDIDGSFVSSDEDSIDYAEEKLEEYDEIDQLYLERLIELRRELWS